MSQSSNIPLPSSAYLDNCDWIKANIAELVAKFPDQWIAVDGGHVLAAGPDLGVVTQTANQKSASADVVYDFVASGSLIF
ncbi:MAG: hypothetical protein IPK83_05485 [Planctomycetes bacterium]|nr:hypothetical protein [Planctomycetota bacterium]